MTISDVEIYQYALGLCRPFTVVGDAMGKREGFIVRIVLADGRSGEGEVAPLPGVSLETLKKSLFQLKESRPLLLGGPCPTDIPYIKALLSSEVFGRNCPSVRFGIESALVNLLGIVSGQSAAELFQGEDRDIAVAGLLQGTPDEIAAQVRTLMQSRCAVFKLKVGSPNIPLDVKKWQTVRSLVGPSGKIRLDVNRAWNLREAVAFVKSIGRDNVEFIEEPVRDPRDLEAFIRETGFEVALDETMWDDTCGNLRLLPGVSVWVIKPTLIGLLGSVDLIRAAADQHKDCVVSSSFESSVGSRMLAHLASLTDRETGMGPCDWFSENLLGPLRADHASVIPARNKQYLWDDIERSLLTRINV